MAETLSARQNRVHIIRDLSMPLLILALATFLLVGMLTMNVPETVAFPGPRFFPAIITAVLYVLAIADTIAVLKKHRTPEQLTTVDSAGTYRDGDPAAAVHQDVLTRVDLRSLLWVVGGFLGFTLTLEFLGWVIGAGMLFWCVARGFGAKSPLVALVTGLTVSSLVYIAFDMGLGLNLPSGILGGGF